MAASRVASGWAGARSVEGVGAGGVPRRVCREGPCSPEMCFSRRMLSGHVPVVFPHPVSLQGAFSQSRICFPSSFRLNLATSGVLAQTIYFSNEKGKDLEVSMKYAYPCPLNLPTSTPSLPAAGGPEGSGGSGDVEQNKCKAERQRE